MKKTTAIDGTLLHQLLASGMSKLKSSVRYLNEINVFPVSDGDTGNNMSRTFEMGISRMVASPSFSEVFSSFAQGMLLGARGNSGSILSQYFWGIHEFTKGKSQISVTEFSAALKNAYKVAYQAVLRPVEGTMLTVMRESIENTAAFLNETTSLEQFLDALAAEMFACVQRTTAGLDILRSNNVVDSGAAGFYLIFDGLRNGLYHTDTHEDHTALFIKKNAQSVNAPLEFRYCTEFLIKLREQRPRAHFVELLQEKGDSLIVTVSDGVLKVHIHTNQPQNILDEFAALGDFVETKVDDMLIQQELTQYSPQQKKHSGYVVLSLVHGDGIMKLFSDLGCDIVFTATQNYHVANDNLHAFFERFTEDNIIFLPNDEEVYTKALALYPPDTHPKVHIVNTHNVIKSYFMLSAMIGTDSVDDVLKSFAEYEQTSFYIAKILLITIQKEHYYVAFTAKDTVIKKDLNTLLQMIESEKNARSISTIVVFHGQTVRDDDVEVVSSFFKNDDELEFILQDGKQDDYDFIIGGM